ncbi:hypothetical protein FPSE_01508 [Fusarium pseudograminearum CS3096]|uniref:Uncharacterized protein n=1 Tax=Fusarium pseudograminearum (strain CS3096) TaxID=1028729 RepID=K3VRX3_FUSPC|nr:hypothetical protein FPSE_01508 [Fusarium pseudograminearum CS3096]EKJ78322.1 hypothetical protein FPSE_01508 [Fusarium pseudograminearum CS3096]
MCILSIAAPAKRAEAWRRSHPYRVVASLVSQLHSSPYAKNEEIPQKEEEAYKDEANEEEEEEALPCLCRLRRQNQARQEGPQRSKCEEMLDSPAGGMFHRPGT